MSLLKKALEPVQEFYHNADHIGSEYFGPKLIDYYHGQYGPDEDFRRVRLDFEFSRPFYEEVGNKRVDAVFVVAEQDLEYLIKHGDRDSPGTEPYLRLIDGSIKRNKQPVDIQFAAALLRTEFHKRKDTYETTLFVTLYTKWDSNGDVSRWESEGGH